MVRKKNNNNIIFKRFISYLCFFLGPITPQNTGFVAVQQTAGKVRIKMIFIQFTFFLSDRFSCNSNWCCT